jgi:hypothetical protein
MIKMWRTAKLILACLAVLALCVAPASAADDSKKADRTSINDLIQQWLEERQAAETNTDAADNDRNARRANRLEARTGPVDTQRRAKTGTLEGDQQADGNPVPGCPWWAAAAGLCENDWWEDKPGVGPPPFDDDKPGNGPPGGQPPGQTEYMP